MIIRLVLTALLVCLFYCPLICGEHPIQQPLTSNQGQRDKGTTYDVRTLTLEEVRYYLEQEKGTMVVDARSKEEYGLGHIPKAINVPIDQFELTFRAQKTALEKAKLVIVYCSGGSCNSSHEAVLLLQKQGLKNLAIFSEGIPAWIKANLPLEKEADCIIRFVVENTSWDQQGSDYNSLTIDNRDTISGRLNGKEYRCQSGSHTISISKWGSRRAGTGKLPNPIVVTLATAQCKEVVIKFPKTIHGNVIISERACKVR